TDIHALHHLVYEVVDNSIDEAMAGRCDFVQIVIHRDNSVTVSDNGGGIPVEINPQKGISTLEMVLTTLHAGGKFGGGAYKVSGGLHGVGVKAVNALSEWLVAEVFRDGYAWRQTYERGVPTSPVEAVREMDADEPTGTHITFMPDKTIFPNIEFSFNTLLQRFREMAYVTRGVSIRLVDERTEPLPIDMTFYFEGGLKAFVRYLNRNRDAIHDVVSGGKEIKYTYMQGGEELEGTMEVDFAFQYTDGTNTTELTFANTINTPDGGTHQTGLRTAITRVINNYARKVGLLKDRDSNFTGRHTLEGLTAIVSVKHPNPQFESQTKVKLMNPEVSAAVSSVVSEVFAEYLEVNPKEGRRVVDKCLSTMRIQEALDKQRELLLGERKSLLSNTTLPGKLADCSDRGMNTELYIVEGDSAGGCFSGDTRVALADGRSISFMEMVEEQARGVEHFGYTIRKDGTVGIERLINARITKRDAEVVRLTLDNGETVTCTPDHRFMLRDGSYKAASALQPSDSVMPHYVAEALTFNHRVVNIERLTQRVDVYDLEVPGTHNFALAAGVFVHNSAKQARDRHFQAILPLRGKILNTERATLNRILDSSEIKALISAIGTGIRDDFNMDRLRYGRVIAMSVAGDESTLVMDDAGRTEFVQIGAFIDDCVEGRRNPDRYQVMAFDLKTHETRFRPLKAVIRHGHEEPMYRIRTRYNRSVKVTASHSVFVYEDGDVRLKKGNEIRPGDLLVASRRLPRPATSPAAVDLLTTFFEAGLTDGLYLQGESVRRVAAQRVLARVAHPERWTEARVALPAERWQELVAYRQAAGVSQMQVAEAVGVKQPITVSHWERGVNRPSLPHMGGYLKAIGWQGDVEYTLIPSRIDERMAQDDTSKNARWREVSCYKPFRDFTTGEVAQLGADVQLAPQAHIDRAFERYLPVSRDLVWFLGWFIAEGTLSAHQVSLNLGAKDERFIDEISAAVESVFGERPRRYNDPESLGIKLYFHSVAAARLLQAWGLGKRAHEKKVPDILFSLPEDLQMAFLEAYFLGDGTISGQNMTFVTNSPALKEGLLYLIGQLGLVASMSEHEPSTSPGAPIQTRWRYFTISVCGKEQLAQCRAIWQRHANAPKVDEHLARPIHKSLSFAPIDADLMGLEVLSAETIEPVGQYVYDFSVQDDENFICGTGGLCAHNTDADVDGAHIRTLLLTFFFRYMTPLITEGHLYIAQPPIFRLDYRKQVEYVYPQGGLSEDQALAQALAKYPEPDKVGVQRYKGLGEMNAEQLWETTMNPEKRTLLQVTLEDAAAADRTFDMLMGPSVPPRRKFINTHARDATLDV
ncbi:MAG: helix-turn-helix domain-containing protein, partial [Anaerolineae bacterium]|nr:helix-turn-helix domain-containing protein [Anaerolineae bacterium]